jgi:plastocyanin
MRGRLPSILFVLAAGTFGASCGSDSNPSSPSGPSDLVSIRVVDNAGNMSFAPEVVTASVGQTIRFANLDDETHAIVSDTPGVFAVPQFEAGQQSASFSIHSAGTVAYHCTIHPGMVGSILVTN